VAIWLILTGFMQLASVVIPVVAMAVLVIAMGILILSGH